MKKIISDRINRTLFEMEVGILFFGAACQFFVFFAEDKNAYSTGLWIGIVTAAVGVFHMWYALDKGLDLDEKSATGYLGRQNAIRYLLYMMVIILTVMTKAGNPLAVFLGMMGLKMAAYMQPFMKNISRWIYGEEILPPLIEEPDESQE